MPPVSQLPPTVSPQLHQILRRMMAKRREDRFPTYEGLLEALEGC